MEYDEKQEKVRYALDKKGVFRHYRTVPYCMCRRGGMADASDSKSDVRKYV